MPGQKPKIQRYARDIKVRGQLPGEPDEVYTRFTKQEYERRRETFDDNPPDHLASFYYDEWAEMGAEGGRPKKWANAAEGKRASRARAKLKQGKTLTQSERELLGLIKPRLGARKYHPDRKASPKERKAKWKAKKGGKM